MSIPIELILQILIVFQCFVFGLFLWITQKGKQKANRFLAVLVGLLFVQFLSNVIEELTGIFHSNYLIPLRMLYGPTLYFYTKQMIYSEVKYTKFDTIHLMLPFFFVFYAPFFSFDIEKWIVGIIVITILGYLVASLLLIHKYQVGIKQIRSDIEKVSLNWIRQLILSFLAVLAIDIFYQFFGLESLQGGEGIIYNVQLLMVLFLITMMVLKALAHPQIFNGFTAEMLTDLNAPTKNKYASSSLTEADLVQYEEGIKTYFEKSKVYLNSDFTLSALAKTLDVSQRDLSYVINTRFDKNFFELVNSYRIEFAKKLLIEQVDRKKTILEVLYESGFNSKSSFYTAFRNHTKMTPKEFRARHKA